MRPWVRKLVIAGAILGVFVLILGLTVYNFGTMMPPSAEAEASYAKLQANGVMPELEKRFGVSIPGCVCHSDNPVITMQHSNRRLSECKQCHGR